MSVPTHNLPDGLAVHLPSMIGTGGRADQYNKHKETLCNKKARLGIHTNLKGWPHIAIFDKTPLPVTANNTDPDPVLFMQEKERASDYVKKHINKRDETPTAGGKIVFPLNKAEC
jgi:hypothetical protein